MYFLYCVLFLSLSLSLYPSIRGPFSLLPFDYGFTSSAYPDLFPGVPAEQLPEEDHAEAPVVVRTLRSLLTANVSSNSTME